jgi:hypothetical protein
MIDKTPAQGLIAYGWALDESGRPVPISAAQRGGHYVCPLCRSPMIARLGEQLQHHYSHERETGCTPETVTRAAVRRWLTIECRDALTKGGGIKINWRCKKCGRYHAADLLSGVTYVTEGYLWDGHYADVGLVDSAGNACAVVLVQDAEVPTQDTLDFFLQEEIITIMVPASLTPSQRTFLEQGQIVGGPCAVLERATNIIRDPDGIKAALRDVVARWPGYFYGPLEVVSGLANVVRIGNRALWLPPDVWTDVIGGTRNRLSSDVQVIMQTWPHTDGGVIWLYYATVRNTSAVGVRRYGPGQTPMASIDERFRRRQTTAVDLVRYLVTQ